jgi:hypothetical protein
MQFCELCTGLYHFRKQLRDDKLIQCECKKENLLDPMKVRALLTCARPEGTRYDQPDCYNNNCSDCKDAKRLETVLFCKHELDFLQRDVTWLSWREGETYKKKKDGTERKRKEFTSVTEPLEKFIEELRKVWPQFQRHHHEAKWQQDDWAYKKKNFPRGTFVVVMDYAENGDLRTGRRTEDQGAHWSQKQYTVFPMVCRFHLDDCEHISSEERGKLHAHFESLGIDKDHRIITETHMIISNDLCHDIGAVQHFCNLLIKHVKEHVNANLTTMYAQSDGCKAQFKNTTHYLWISEQYEKTGIRADWTFFCSCHGKCDCDPEGGACKNVVKLHQLRDSAQNRTIINNIDELAAFLEANFKNPTKSYFAKKGGGAIYQRHIHYVKASEIEVTRRDLVHAEYSLKKSDCYRQICDIGEPGVVVCRHRSCHQCRHDHKDEVGGDCIDLDFARCKEEAHCGAPQERALTAVQFEQDEEAMEFRALALQEQARRIQSGEIVCVANHDVETKSCLPFLIGKVCQTPLLAFGDSFFKSKR